MLEGKCGEVLQYITENGFVIEAMKMFNLERQICEEFFDVYNGVSPDYLVSVMFVNISEFFVYTITLLVFIRMCQKYR